MAATASLLLLVAATCTVASDAKATATAKNPPQSIGSVVQSIALPQRLKTFDRLQQSAGKRNLQELWISCTIAGGKIDEKDGKCRRCPDTNSDRNCCVINLDDFSLQCNICELLNGLEESCGLYDCETNIETETTTCKGCIETSGGGLDGTLCSDFTCPPAAYGQCTCNSVRWNGQDCGPCEFSDSYISFDCSAVNSDGPRVTGPTAMPTIPPTATPTAAPTPQPTPRPTPLPGDPTYSPTQEAVRLCSEADGTLSEDRQKCKICVNRKEFDENVCPMCGLIADDDADGEEGAQQEEEKKIDCNNFSCTEDYSTDIMNCRGCLGSTSVGSNICLNYNCPSTMMTSDMSECTCREFILEGRLCRSCSFDGDDGTLVYDCGNVGGPTSGASRGSLKLASGVSVLLGFIMYVSF